VLKKHGAFFIQKKYRLLQRNTSRSVALPGLAGKQGKQLLPKEVKANVGVVKKHTW
jgi:hypothetical protein